MILDQFQNFYNQKMMSFNKSKGKNEDDEIDTEVNNIIESGGNS